jgi:transcriptional regulator with XRE-family HTH domain
MPNTEIEKFAKFVKEKRTALGMSGTELAEKVFGNKNRKSYISEIESGTRKGVTIDVMGRILKALNSEIKYYEF